MQFLEVDTVSMKIDVGERLPLRYTFGAPARQWLQLIRWTVLLWVLPVAFYAATLDSWASFHFEWFQLVVPLWGVVLVLGVRNALSTLTFEITEREVRVRGKYGKKNAGWTAALDEYEGVAHVVITHADWIGNKEEHGVVLQHATAPDRSLPLYWGRKRARAEQLLPTYSTLLARPIVEARSEA